MDHKLLSSYEQLPFPASGKLQLLAPFQKYEVSGFGSGPCGQFQRGLFLGSCAAILPSTSYASLQRCLEHRGIGVVPSGIPLTVRQQSGLSFEEFFLEIRSSSVELTVGDLEGLRRGIYAFEECLSGHLGTDDLIVHLHRKAKIRHRITRCFMTPNTRPPLCEDELDDAIDYYPDGYLDRLAHEGMNGVWLTLYLHDIPCSAFPSHGVTSERKLRKLQRIVDQCSRYGIKCYLFMAEPHGFRNSWKSFTEDEASLHPELVGHRDTDCGYFCTSTAAGQSYLRETLRYVFHRVRGLGGVINIMCQESSLPCALWKLYPHVKSCTCPRCAGRTASELFVEIARVMGDAIHSESPEAEFIGWFYAACYIEGDPENRILQEIARAWPRDLILMRNCETGGRSVQLGREHLVQDYSLSYSRASEAWLELASAAVRPGGKIQTCCSHEDASVPYIPVPGNLYRLYGDLLGTRCDTVMQCWYFGNYPSLMNRAAGRLSFLPYPESEEAFLEELLRPQWGSQSGEVSTCFRLFGESYRLFPENLNFKWFGPLHHSIVFPWHLFPADLPMAPSYTQGFPKNSGDRIGECIGYGHDYGEIRCLLGKMDQLWQAGLERLEPLAATESQHQEVALARAVGIQIASSRRLFEFYHLRERMIYEKSDYRSSLASLVREEIRDTRLMERLCAEDPRLGFHSEVESYLFYPEKLACRAALLENLLAEDFPRFDCQSSELQAWTGESRGADSVVAGCGCESATRLRLGESSLLVYCEGDRLYFHFKDVGEYGRLDLEPGRLSAIISVTFYGDPTRRINLGPMLGLSIEASWHEVLIVVDLNAFRGYRQSLRGPLRFNVSCGEHGVRVRHPWPSRLCMGDANPEDLVFLYLD